MASPTQGGSPPLSVTYEGFVETTMDALILFEACLQGQLYHVPRRPHDRERETLIRSGAVFVYEEHSSGIKRWTDGYNWSPSRILGNFLIYRELEGPFPPGEKKRARKPKKNAPSKTAESARVAAVLNNSSAVPGLEDGEQHRADSERSLIGSLIDSYPFKEGGLVKKTISVQWQGVPHHLVSYYKVEDVLARKLVSPSDHPRFGRLIPRSALFSQQNFRNPVSDQDPKFMAQFHSDGGFDQHHLHPHGFALPTAASRSMSLPGGPIMVQEMYRSGFPGHPPPQYSIAPQLQPAMAMVPQFAPNGHFDAHSGAPGFHGFDHAPHSRARSSISGSVGAADYHHARVMTTMSPPRRHSNAAATVFDHGVSHNISTLPQMDAFQEPRTVPMDPNMAEAYYETARSGAVSVPVTAQEAFENSMASINGLHIDMFSGMAHDDRDREGDLGHSWTVSDFGAADGQRADPTGLPNYDPGLADASTASIQHNPGLDFHRVNGVQPDGLTPRPDIEHEGQPHEPVHRHNGLHHGSELHDDVNASVDHEHDTNREVGLDTTSPSLGNHTQYQQHTASFEHELHNGSGLKEEAHNHAAVQHNLHNHVDLEHGLHDHVDLGHGRQDHSVPGHDAKQ